MSPVKNGGSGMTLVKIYFFCEQEQQLQKHPTLDKNSYCVYGTLEGYRCIYAFVEAAALFSIVLRYAGAPIATRASFFFSFCLFGDVAFSEYFFCIISAFSLYGL